MKIETEDGGPEYDPAVHLDAELADLGPQYPATSPELAYELDQAAAIELTGYDPAEYAAAQQQAAVLELARAEQDEQDAERASGPRHRRFSAEERLARALQRVESGTYTAPAPRITRRCS